MKELEKQEEEKNLKLRQKIEQKQADYSRLRSQQLSAKSMRAATLATGSYHSIDNADSPPSKSLIKKEFSKSLPNSPRTISGDREAPKTPRKDLFKGDDFSDVPEQKPPAVVPNDPVSQYFMNIQSDEDLKKIEDFEKILKKRQKKLRVRMNARSTKYEQETANITSQLPPSSNRNKISKALKDIEKALSNHEPSVSFWPEDRVKTVTRACRVLLELLATSENEKTAFRFFKGYSIIAKVLILQSGSKENYSPLPDRLIRILLQVLKIAGSTDENTIFDSIKFQLHTASKSLNWITEKVNQIFKTVSIKAYIYFQSCFCKAVKQ